MAGFNYSQRLFSALYTSVLAFTHVSYPLEIQGYNGQSVKLTTLFYQSRELMCGVLSQLQHTL